MPSYFVRVALITAVCRSIWPATITLGLAVKLRTTPIEEGPKGEGSLMVSL